MADAVVARAQGSQPDHQVLIIGSGFAGLGMAIKLREQGFTDFTVVEKEEDVGGTWYVNTYPGCACDVQSHMYSFSFEPNPHWSHEFAPQPEILRYLRHCADKYQVRSQIQFSTQAVSARYDERAQLWRVRLARSSDVKALMAKHGMKPGEVPAGAVIDTVPSREVSARFLISGMGGLSTPAYPKLKGLERFEGETFHSQRWNHGYDLRGKRVAVIGTGASAIQFVPELVPQVARLDLHQRSAAWVLPKPDRVISSLEQKLYARVPMARKAHRLALYSRLEGRAVAFAYAPQFLRVAEVMARGYIRSLVRDRSLRKKLTPDYAFGCKRVLLSNNWYQAVTQPNVDVITDGIAEVTENAIITQNGQRREVDAIIYGTGFRVADLVPRGLIYGRGGRDVSDFWPNGPEAYKGTTLKGCPNLFLLVGPNTGLGHNSIIYMIESQIAYVLDALKLARERQITELEVRAAVLDEFNQRLQEQSQATVWTRGGCTSYYLHPETGRNIAVWPDFTFQFRRITRHFDLANYTVKTADAVAATSPSSLRQAS